MQVAEEFPDHAVVNSAQLHGRSIGRGQILAELFQVAAVTSKSMRRGISHRLQILKEFFDGALHSVAAAQLCTSSLTSRTRFDRYRRLLFMLRLLPVATILDARPEDTAFGSLFHDKRRATFRARLRDRRIGRAEIAIGITVAAIENSVAPFGKTLRNFSLSAFRTLDSQRL